MAAQRASGDIALGFPDEHLVRSSPALLHPPRYPAGAAFRSRGRTGEGGRGGRLRCRHGRWTTCTRSRVSAGPTSRCSRAGRCWPRSRARPRACASGTLVTGVTYRNPALLAKQVTTLDTISGGRAILGLGAAWNEVEHEGYGYDFPPIRERMDRLEEALTIIKAMFTEERPTFTGRYYRIDQAFNVPRPVQPGGPKILVGGGGEQRTLRIAAKHADMTHWFALGLDGLQAQDRGPRALLRGDRPGPVDHRADGRRAGDGRRVRSRRQGAPRDASRPSGGRTSRSGRPSRRPRRCVRTSTPGSRASRSTTTCTGRPSRSRASAIS